MDRTRHMLKNLMNDECGADLIEYAFVASVLALSAVAAQGNLVNRAQNEFNVIANYF